MIHHDSPCSYDMMKIRAEQTFPLEGRINMDQLERRCNIDGMCEAYVDETQAQ